MMPIPIIVNPGTRNDHPLQDACAHIHNTHSTIVHTQTHTHTFTQASCTHVRIHACIYHMYAYTHTHTHTYQGLFLTAHTAGMAVPRMLPTDVCAFQIPINKPRLFFPNQFPITAITLGQPVDCQEKERIQIFPEVAIAKTTQTCTYSHAQRMQLNVSVYVVSTLVRLSKTLAKL